MTKSGSDRVTATKEENAVPLTVEGLLRDYLNQRADCLPDAEDPFEGGAFPGRPHLEDEGDTNAHQAVGLLLTLVILPRPVIAS